MKTFKKANLIAVFLVIGLFCFPQQVHAGTRAILSGGKIKITDGIETVTVNSEGRLDIIPHAHADEGTIHFHVNNIGASINYILIDMSDIVNYPHVHTDYLHLDNFYVEVDANASADYVIKIGVLENIDASNGDRYTAFHVSGTKQTGKDKEIFLPLLPAGIRMRSLSIATHDISLNDSSYQTDVNMKTTLDPSTADTPPGNGDVVCEIVINAGQINLAINLSYHSHPD